MGEVAKEEVVQRAPVQLDQGLLGAPHVALAQPVHQLLEDEAHERPTERPRRDAGEEVEELERIAAVAVAVADQGQLRHADHALAHELPQVLEDLGVEGVQVVDAEVVVVAGALTTGGEAPDHVLPLQHCHGEALGRQHARRIQPAHPGPQDDDVRAKPV